MKHLRLRTLPLTVVCVIASGTFPAHAADYSPNVGAAAPKKLLWGDTHVHSGWSADAGAFGNRLGPEEAVRFARGEGRHGSFD